MNIREKINKIPSILDRLCKLEKTNSSSASSTIIEVTAFTEITNGDAGLYYLTVEDNTDPNDVKDVGEYIKLDDGSIIYQGITAQDMLVQHPRITGVPTDVSYRGISTIGGYGSDAVISISNTFAITSSIQPKAGVINIDNVKLKTVQFSKSLDNYLDNVNLLIIAKELTAFSNITNPAVISSQIIADLKLTQSGNRGSLYEFSVNSDIVLKKNMVIELYYKGTAGNTDSMDLRAPMYNLKFNK